MAIQKKNPENPFFIGIEIPDKYFCDRKKETEQLIKYVENGFNIVLKSPRRIGKSSLIKHLFEQPQIKDRYNTLYVDIYGTANRNEFNMALERAFMESPFFKTTKLWKRFKTWAKEIDVNLGSYDGNKVTLPSISFHGNNTTHFRMEDIFETFEDSNKPGIIVFDEFQQIENYPERMAATIRASVQMMNNTRFIFSGSRRHMLNTMFADYGQPFYKSARSMDIDIINLDAYREFAKENFHKYNKDIDDDAIDFVYYLFSGNTYNLQETMKQVFSVIEPGEKADKQMILESIDVILDSRDTEYRDLLDRVKSQKDRKLLFCIAAEGVATNLTSSGMMKTYRLDNASSVQHSLENLLEGKLDLITRIVKNHYELRDRMLELWIAKTGMYLEYKTRDPKTRFNNEQKLKNQRPDIPKPTEQL